MAGQGPHRGEIYYVDLGPGRGHEQAGRRPLLIVSIGPLNKSAARLVIGAPLTTTDWGNRMHVRIEPSESGLDRISFAMPEMVRWFSSDKLLRRVGRVRVGTVDTVAGYVGILIGLGRSR